MGEIYQISLVALCFQFGRYLLISYSQSNTQPATLQGIWNDVQLKLVGKRQEGINTTGRGTYPNMLDAHPPFQIDGNFGCTAGIAEMLMQSHDSALHILPALPDQWANGQISGLIARGGFKAAIIWENKQIKQLKIKSNLGGNCRLRFNDNQINLNNVQLVSAQAKNSNEFYEVPKVKAPLISPLAKLKKVVIPASKDFDLPTKAGKEYGFNF